MTIPEAVRLVLQAGAMGQGRRGAAARHGRAGAHRRPRAPADPHVGAARGRGHRDPVHRPAAGREALRGAALRRRAHAHDAPRAHPRVGAGRQARGRGCSPRSPSSRRWRATATRRRSSASSSSSCPSTSSRVTSLVEPVPHAGSPGHRASGHAPAAPGRPDARWRRTTRQTLEAFAAAIVLIVSSPLWALMWIEAAQRGVASPLTQGDARRAHAPSLSPAHQRRAHADRPPQHRAAHAGRARRADGLPALQHRPRADRALGGAPPARHAAPARQRDTMRNGVGGAAA